MKVGKVLKFDTAKFGLIIQIFSEKERSGARSFFSPAEERPKRYLSALITGLAEIIGPAVPLPPPLSVGVLEKF